MRFLWYDFLWYLWQKRLSEARCEISVSRFYIGVDHNWRVACFYNWRQHYSFLWSEKIIWRNCWLIQEIWKNPRVRRNLEIGQKQNLPLSGWEDGSPPVAQYKSCCMMFSRGKSGNCKCVSGSFLIPCMSREPVEAWGSFDWHPSTEGFTCSGSCTLVLLCSRHL